jgi:hypothetical protein
MCLLVYRAPVLDTGASAAASDCAVAATVLNLLTDHATTAGRPRVPLVVAHSYRLYHVAIDRPSARSPS